MCWVCVCGGGGVCVCVCVVGRGLCAQHYVNSPPTPEHGSVPWIVGVTGGWVGSEMPAARLICALICAQPPLSG